MASLCVNIDHIATLRQARREAEPDPVAAVAIVEMAGSTGITVHLREDARHIQERDVRLIREVVRGHLNLEMAATPAMVDRALALRPDMATLVPERREEVTTEGGLDVAGHLPQMREATRRLQDAGIGVSMFIDPAPAQIEASAACGALEVEFHTGTYCRACAGIAGRLTERIAGAPENPARRELQTLRAASAQAQQAGLIVNAGHGLNYHNVQPVAAIVGMHELNIGHAIISRAVFIGLHAAVAEMARLIAEADPAQFEQRQA